MTRAVLTAFLIAGTVSASVSPEQRAVDYLSREVPQWSRENHCFSCHNNGDGARALYVARRLSYRVPEEAVRDTSQWLARPDNWDHNKGDAGFSDKKLARIQFAAALTEAGGDPKIPIRAAESLLPYQEDDGSWQVDAAGATGSPATYGACLATYIARRTLEKSDAARFRSEITRADRWFLDVPVKSMLEAAAVVLALHDRDSAPARKKLTDNIESIARGQASDGGWGPYPRSPSEPFDTAVVVLALAAAGDRAAMGQRGREYLLKAQLPSGGWTETTRPAGSQSYAQRISTSAWATLALLETSRPKSALESVNPDFFAANKSLTDRVRSRERSSAI